MMDHPNFSSLGSRAKVGDLSTSPMRVGMTTDSKIKSPTSQDDDKFYQPELGDIPHAPLTKVRREKIA